MEILKYRLGPGQPWREMTGIMGPKGDKGDKGDRGEKGDAGTSVVILGSYNSVAELRAAHPTGNLGDAYLINGDLYVWEGSSWTNVGNIKGPQGAPGETGPQGPQGEKGEPGMTKQEITAYIQQELGVIEYGSY